MSARILSGGGNDADHEDKHRQKLYGSLLEEEVVTSPNTANTHPQEHYHGSRRTSTGRRQSSVVVVAASDCSAFSTWEEAEVYNGGGDSSSSASTTTSSLVVVDTDAVDPNSTGDEDNYGSMFRFVVLLLIPLVPFGGHVFKSSISSLEVFMLEDEPLQMTPTKYGILNSSFVFGSLFLSILGGRCIDKNDRRGILGFVSVVLIGEMIFIFALSIKSYPLLLFGGIIFGSAQGLASVGHRAIVSRYFAGKDIMFAIGYTHGVACFSKMAARASAVPIMYQFDSNYIAVFYCMLVVSVGSLLAAYFYARLSAKQQQRRLTASSTRHPTSPTGMKNNVLPSNLTMVVEKPTETTPLFVRQISELSNSEDPEESGLSSRQHVDANTKLDELAIVEENTIPSTPSLCTIFPGIENFYTLSTAFWLICALHSLYKVVFHMFPNISGHFLIERRGMTPEEAGYISSFLTFFAIVGAPVTGYVLDQNGGQLYITLFTGVLPIISYIALSFSSIAPIYTILALSVADACIPTILHALLPLSVDKSQYGIAFGISEVVDASSNIIGNIIVGYLRDTTGSYVAPMIFIILVSLIGTVLSVILFVHDKNEHGSFFNSPMKK